MEQRHHLFDIQRSEAELLENFKKLVQINHVHKRNRQLVFQYTAEPHRNNNQDEFYNFVSIIIKPDENRSIREFLYNIYEKLDLSFLFAYFSKEHAEELKGLNMESIMKLKEIMDQVI